MKIIFLLGCLVALIPSSSYAVSPKICDAGYAKDIVYNMTSMNHGRMKYALTNYYRDVSADTDRALTSICQADETTENVINKIENVCNQACMKHAPEYNKSQKLLLKKCAAICKLSKEALIELSNKEISSAAPVKVESTQEQEAPKSSMECEQKIIPDICKQCNEFEKLVKANNSSLKGIESIKECFNPDDPPKSYINANKSSTKDGSITGESKFTFFPDTHDRSEPTEAIEKYLDQLKKEGIKVLFMELALDNFTLAPQDSLPKDSEIEEILNPNYPKKNYLKLIKAAHAKGIAIEGYFPKDSDKAWDNIKPWRAKRKHDNNSDQMYTYSILEKSKKYPTVDKFLILSGAAHTNSYYENGNIETNTHMFGEFASQGISPKDLRLIELRTRKYPETSIKYNLSVGDYMVPLPKGERPGCGKFESRSAADLLLFVDGI